MKSIFLLLKDIENVIQEYFETYPVDEKPEKDLIPAGLTKIPTYIGHLIPRKSQSNDLLGEAPFIIIRSMDGTQKYNQENALTHEVNVSIFACLHNQESETNTDAGYHDILNVMERIMLALNSKQYWGDNYWKLKDELQWTTGTEKEITTIYGAGQQQHPKYGASIKMVFENFVVKPPSLSSIGGGPRR